LFKTLARKLLTDPTSRQVSRYAGGVLDTNRGQGAVALQAQLRQLGLVPDGQAGQQVTPAHMQLREAGILIVRCPVPQFRLWSLVAMEKLA